MLYRTNFIISVITAATVTMSAGNNFAEITNICGCMPSLLIEGKPGTGKSTMTTLLSNMFNCTKNSSVLVVNDISQSALDNLTQQITGIPIWYKYIYIQTKIHL